MKRSAPLTRKAPLDVGEKARERGSSFASRGDGLKRRRKGRARDRTASERWYAALAQECQHPACPGQHGRLALHHVTYEQCVERESGDVWDPRNALTLCDGCHAAHHNRSKPLALSMLPDSVFEFAAELLGPARAYEYLRRRYGGEDARLDALLGVEWKAAA